MTFHIKTFGCRQNFAESDELIEKLKKYLNPTSEKTADIIIIRACAVTARAEQKVRQQIRAYKKQEKIVLVLGCFFKKINDTDEYFKSDKDLLKFIAKKTESRISTPYGRIVRDNKVRAFIKIQEGCDFNCSFCITRVLRGMAKDIPRTKILKQIKQKEARGFQEIVLTGTNILLRKDIHNLVKTILKETEIPRIRFGSIDPRLVSKKFINLFNDPRLMPHIHLSIQSGSEKILKDMTRLIKISKIKSIAKELRSINPLLNITADIIVGFPTETNSDFEKTLKLAKNLELSKIHYFPYSLRPKTSAEKLNILPQKTIKSRLTRIKELDKKLRAKAEKKILGKKFLVLFEACKNNICYGYTPNFMRIKYRSEKNLTNKIKKIIIILNN